MDVVQGAVKTGDVFLVVTDASESYNNVGKNKDDDLEEEPEEDSFLSIGEDLVMKLRKYESQKVDTVAEDSSTVCEHTTESYRNDPKVESTIARCIAILPTCAAGGPDDPGVLAFAFNSPLLSVVWADLPGMFKDKPMLSNENARDILPIGPPLYDPDFLQIEQIDFLGRLPYCCEVRIESFDESKGIQMKMEADEGNDDKEKKVDDQNRSNNFGGERFTRAL
ncbi:hypothetical protein ACHAWO_003477 [Cyclotella atomus]|uniref:Uncharacterized protein n=1 Tax=Cyclotella atomus TaxID=382360 RepID=A0ABD3NKK3_9STRA